MTQKIQKLYLDKLALAALLFIGTLTFLYTATPETQIVDAQTQSCFTKIQRNKCQREVDRNCEANGAASPTALDGCISSIASRYTEVLGVCKDSRNPSKCHKEVEEACKDKRGEEKSDCRREEASEFKNKVESFFGPDTGKHQCGNLEDVDSNVKTQFNFGCLGKKAPEGMTPLEDLIYAILRFLAAGVGVVIVLFIILAGIQYSSSEGNAEATTSAKNKIRNAVIGLIIYIFAFALVQYLVPGGAFALLITGVDSSILASQLMEVVK